MVWFRLPLVVLLAGDQWIISETKPFSTYGSIFILHLNFASRPGAFAVSRIGRGSCYKSPISLLAAYRNQQIRENDNAVAFGSI